MNKKERIKEEKVQKIHKVLLDLRDKYIKKGQEYEFMAACRNVSNICFEMVRSNQFIDDINTKHYLNKLDIQLKEREMNKTKP